MPVSDLHLNSSMFCAFFVLWPTPLKCGTVYPGRGRGVTPDVTEQERVNTGTVNLHSIHANSLKGADCDPLLTGPAPPHTHTHLQTLPVFSSIHVCMHMHTYKHTHTPSPAETTAASVYNREGSGPCCTHVDCSCATHTRAHTQVHGAHMPFFMRSLMTSCSIRVTASTYAS